MDHESAAMRVTDWVEGHLDAEAAAAMDAHLLGCAECRGVANTLRQVRAQVAAHGAPLFAPHPSADALATFVLDPHALPLDALATMGAHIRSCPACSAEGTQIRSAVAFSPLRGFRAWLGSTPGPQVWLRPALAVVAIALLYPAYLGFVEYPRAREHADRLEAIVRATPAPSPRASARMWNGGGVDALVLTSTTRGTGGGLPSIRLRPGQPAQPIMVDHVLTSTADPVTVTLYSETDGIAWRFEGPRSEVWDTPRGLIALLVPADRLTPGEYRLVITDRNASAPEFSAGFRVLPPRLY